MLVHINCAKCVGIEAVPVTVEMSMERGIGVHLVGLADIAVKESLLRTSTALQAMGFSIPGKKIIINLAPADMHKSGSGYDLPIALGIIAASGQKALPGIDRYVIMGELGLDGSVRDIAGALPFAELAANLGLEGVIFPLRSAMEAADFKSIKVYGVRSLDEVIRILEEGEGCEDLLVWNNAASGGLEPGSGGMDASVSAGIDGEIPDFADIIGQEGAKRGIEIAAAGGHNLIMIGPPGAGKSSLARAMSGILPPMTREEALVTSKIYSVTGKGTLTSGLIRRRPFRSPHYSASIAALVGGGGGDGVQPGEISLAHNGVLFLDEMGQMPRSVIEALRGPLEDRKVTISRLRAKVGYPASFALVAASNPCPCGFWGEGDRCNCSPTQRIGYLSKLSGPIMDRIDLQVFLHSIDSSLILKAPKAESSAAVAERVRAAREIQQKRFAGCAAAVNAEMNNKMIERFCPLSPACEDVLEQIMSKQEMSMRSYFRIIKVARTIADLARSPDILPDHIMEASCYRFLDRRNF